MHQLSWRFVEDRHLEVVFLIDDSEIQGHTFLQHIEYHIVKQFQNQLTCIDRLCYIKMVLRICVEMETIT